VPTLAEMTAGALNVLDDDPDGLFLMVEGGAVDWASHNNRSERMVEEELAFADAVDAVIDWVGEKGDWSETLLIVTGDHETGYVTRAAEGDPEADTPWAWQPLGSNGRGRLPGMGWHSGSHTNSLIPLYARGAGCRRLRAMAVGTDPHRGDYVDNTAIARLIFALLES
jgi:alkaline phosphatase